MRLVQVMIPAGKRRAILGVLDTEEIDYAVTDETSGREYTALVTFPLPVAAVEPVLERLRDAGIERDAYTVVVDAETVVSRRFEELNEAYEEGDDGGRISRDELIVRAGELAPDTVTFTVLTVISCVVATAGLLLDSPAVVVGSMVIAPLVGPAMATSVGTVIDDEDLFRRGAKLQVAGGILSVAAAALFALALRWTGTVPLTAEEVFAIGEVSERLSPDVLSLAIALGAGVAGALSLSSGVSTALVGVMIAAALVPPVAVVGIGVAWGQPMRVFGSAVLVLVNFLSINFSALAVLWYKGYRPERWFHFDEARTATVTRLLALGLSILLLSGFLVGVTLDTARTAGFEEEARSGVQNIVRAHGLSFLSMDITYSGFPFRHPSNVTVVVGHQPDEDPPSLVGPLSSEINESVDNPLVSLGQTSGVTVQVRYVTVESTSSAPSPSQSSTENGRTTPNAPVARPRGAVG